MSIIKLGEKSYTSFYPKLFWLGTENAYPHDEVC